MQDNHKRQLQSRKERILSLILILLFCSFIGLGNLLNAKGLNQIIDKQKVSFQSWKTVASTVESELKNQFSGRLKLIDLYGLSMKILNKKMIGNFEFVKDDDGIMQLFGTYPNTSAFEKSLFSLSDYCTENGIPLVFLQIPNKDEHLSLSKEMYFSGHISQDFIDSLRDYGIDVLNLQTFMNTDSEAPKRTDFFFHSDVHFTTYGEFWAAKTLANHLHTQYGISFNKLDKIFDINQYNVEAFDFLGNTARSSGRYFSKIDRFENYTPKFPTQFSLFNKQDELTRTGNFQAVQMNGYENKPYNLYTYWITNYGQYPEPYYEYQNLENVEGPEILMLLDSGFMKGATFLSLACGNTTIIDTRMLDGIPYVEYALSLKNYDAIVVCGASQSFLSSSFSVKTQLPQLPEKMEQIADYWIGTHGMYIDKYNDKALRDQSCITIDPTQSMIKIDGWAADFSAMNPLFALYLQVGDKVIQCRYGIERTSVSTHFQNENLLRTGFSVSIPAKYFSGNSVEEISFIQIGADGTYQFEPVNVKVQY